METPRRCRNCSTEIVLVPGRPGPKPTLCPACSKLSRYEKLTPEARERHASRANSRIKSDPKRHAEYGRRVYWRMKLSAIEKLGGKCEGCGTTNPLVLSINHMDGRTATGDTRKSRELYRAVLADEKGFDLRCLNCQLLWEYSRGRILLPTAKEFAHLHKLM